jgi:hypothetical protein
MLVKLTIAVNFTNFSANFLVPKKYMAKLQVQKSFEWKLSSKKAAHKMLVKLTPDQSLGG